MQILLMAKISYLKIAIKLLGSNFYIRKLIQHRIIVNLVIVLNKNICTPAVVECAFCVISFSQNC